MHPSSGCPYHITEGLHLTEAFLSDIWCRDAKRVNNYAYTNSKTEVGYLSTVVAKQNA